MLVVLSACKKNPWGHSATPQVPLGATTLANKPLSRLIDSILYALPESPNPQTSNQGNLNPEMLKPKPWAGLGPYDTFGETCSASSSPQLAVSVSKGVWE